MNWTFIRIALLVIAAVFAPFTLSRVNGDFSHPSILFFLGMTGFGIFSVIFSIGIQYKNPRMNESWIKPSFSDNPFKNKQPLQVFNISAELFMALGIGGVFWGMFSQPVTYVWEIPLALGIGIWIGVRMCISLYKDKISG